MIEEEVRGGIEEEGGVWRDRRGKREKRVYVKMLRGFGLRGEEGETCLERLREKPHCEEDFLQKEWVFKS